MNRPSATYTPTIGEVVEASDGSVLYRVTDIQRIPSLLLISGHEVNKNGKRIVAADGEGNAISDVVEL